MQLDSTKIVSGKTGAIHITVPGKLPGMLMRYHGGMLVIVLICFIQPLSIPFFQLVSKRPIKFIQ